MIDFRIYKILYWLIVLISIISQEMIYANLIEIVHSLIKFEYFLYYKITNNKKSKLIYYKNVLYPLPHLM